ncbi:hypothetical protein PENTCL1PPCAC_8120, partial [Pristionchus entomophagus]
MSVETVKYVPSTIGVNTERQKPRVTDKFHYRIAVKEDQPEILECVLTGFLNTDSHALALKLTRTEAHELVRWFVERSLHTPYSVMVYDKSTRKLAGIRLYSVIHRDQTKDFEPFKLDYASMADNVRIWYNLTDKQQNKIWSLRLEVQKTLHHEITFVDPAFQRQGIAQHFINLLNIKQ